MAKQIFEKKEETNIRCYGIFLMKKFKGLLFWTLCFIAVEIVSYYLLGAVTPLGG